MASNEFSFPKFLTLEEVAELLHIPLSKVRQLIRSKIIWPVVTISERDRVVPVESFEQAVAKMMEERDERGHRIERLVRRRRVRE